MLSHLFLLELPRYAKRSIVISVDISLCVLTVWLSFYLRLGEFVSLSGNLFWAVVISVAFAVPVFVAFGLYRAIFRYAGWRAMFLVSRASLVYGMLYVSVITTIGITDVPRTIGFIQPLLLFLTVGGSRALAHYWLGGYYQNTKDNNFPVALVYGAGQAGRQLVSALESSSEMRVVGFLDDDDMN